MKVPGAEPAAVRKEVLRLIGREGEPPAQLAPPEDGTQDRIELTDGEGKVRMRLDVRADGSPVLEMLDAAGRPRLVLVLVLDAAGAPSLRFRDAEGRPVAGPPGSLALGPPPTPKSPEAPPPPPAR